MSTAASITTPVNVLDHLRLAYKVASSFRRQGLFAGLEFDDLKQLAVIGFVSAAKHFDPERGKWAAYAARAMRRVINVQAGGHLGLGLPRRVDSARLLSKVRELKGRSRRAAISAGFLSVRAVVSWPMTYGHAGDRRQACTK